MGLSKRHHYIPQFLIRQFAAEDGMLYLYDKEKGVFVKEMRSPKAVFFEINRNTVDIGGIPNDNMEKLYAQLDERFAVAVKSLFSSHRVELDYLADLLIFVSTLRWRLPANDAKFEGISKELSYENLPINIRRRDGGKIDEKALQHLLDSEVFNFSKRIIAPFLQLYENDTISENKLLKAFNNTYFNYDNRQLSILGDTPLIEDELADTHNFGNFILPVGSYGTLISSGIGSRNVNNPLFAMNKDLLVFHQARKYVVCSSREHLQKIIDAYQMTVAFEMVGEISSQIFKFT